MSQAVDLLNSLPEDEVTVASIEPATEPHIVVNADKTVTVPDELKRILVQHEHNIETFTFDCPRYWDGHDLSDMIMQIVYRRSDGHKAPHPVENLRVDETDTRTIHFDWTISENVTLVSGTLSIIVCAKTATVDGEREREWHTIPNKDLYVNESMDCSGEEIVEMHPDVIGAILKRLDTVEKGGVSTERLDQAIADYMAKNPVTGGSDLRVAEIALLSASWITVNNSYYAQRVEVEGATKYSQVVLTPSVEQLDIFHDKDLTFVTENEGGVITVFAIGQKPQNDYVIQATIKEVAV